ncbi:hypothetical protein Airi02_001080 [Actinoallomurus iriomotensis]|uniref:Uncharacterized protein n=1 Tax=Actinoallomurus iriomotensis TaxID=478107 RepID=A0A9W6VXU4_9ACTN|nr:hypothetical protein Airi02_001080 [Actinoallomurus iriomotensis]
MRSDLPFTDPLEPEEPPLAVPPLHAERPTRSTNAAAAAASAAKRRGRLSNPNLQHTRKPIGLLTCLDRGGDQC